MKKKPSLFGLYNESLELRKKYPGDLVNNIDFNQWLNDRGWNRYEFDFNLKLLQDLNAATRRREWGDDDDE